MKQNLSNEVRFGPKLVSRVMFLLMAMSLVGCVAAIPIIYYANKQSGYVVTVQMDVEANKVYQTALELLENPPEKDMPPGYKEITNIKKDDKKLSVAFDVVFKDGTNHDQVTVTSIGANRSQLVAVADTPGDKKADESTSLSIVRIICDKLGVKYNLIKG